jgi:hypothetical protein
MTISKHMILLKTRAFKNLSLLILLMLHSLRQRASFVRIARSALSNEALDVFLS